MTNAPSVSETPRKRFESSRSVTRKGVADYQTVLKAETMPPLEP